MMNNLNEFWTKEYENVSSLFTRFLDLYIKAFFVYLAVESLFFKLAIEAPNIQWKRAFFCFAILCCLLLYATILCGYVTWRRLRIKRQVALDKLGRDTQSELFVGSWVNRIFFAFNTFVIANWLLIILGILPELDVR